jgi:transposase
MPRPNRKFSTKTCEWDDETRLRIVIRYEDGWSQYKIANSFDPPLPRTTVMNIIKSYKEKGTVANKARSGRPSLLSEHEKEQIAKEVKKNAHTRRATIKETADRLALGVSDKTIRRAMKEKGMAVFRVVA